MFFLYNSATGIIALDGRLGCLEASFNDRPQRLVEAIAETLNVTMLTENGLQFWRYWDTPIYKKLVKAQDTMAEYEILLVNVFPKYFVAVKVTVTNCSHIGKQLSYTITLPS